MTHGREVVVMVFVGAVIFAAPLVGVADWVSNGPEGGEIVSLVAAEGPNVPWIVGTSSGVYLSEDGGTRWRFSGLAGHRVAALVREPSRPSVIWAGTAGEYSWNGNDGVFLSTDGGESWTPARDGLEDPTYPPAHPYFRYRAISSLLVDPEDPMRVWAGTGSNGGLFHSDDGGLSWATAIDVQETVEVLVADPVNRGVFFVCFRQSGLFKSVDSGRTWAFVGDDLPWTASGGQISYVPLLSLSLSPADPGVIVGASDLEVFISGDGGEHWLSLGGLQSGVTAEAEITKVACHPEEAGTFFVSTRFDGVFRSSDDGPQWQSLGEGLECDVAPDDFGVGFRRGTALAITRYDGTVLLGTERHGVFRLSPDRRSWEQVNRGLTAVSVSSIAVNPAAPHQVVAATRGVGIAVSSDGGATWREANFGVTGACGPPDSHPWSAPVPDCRAMTTALWSSDGRSLLVGGECGLYRSPPGTWSWHLEHSPGPWVDAIVTEPGNTDRIYVSKNDTDFLRSSDGGWTWTELSQHYIGFWFEVTGSYLPSFGAVRTLAVLPADPGTVVAGTTQGLVVSGDGGESWSGPAADINDTCPEGEWTVVSAIAVDSPSAAIYAGTSCGVFVSHDGGEGWARIGLEGQDVRALAVNSTGVFAATWGAGVWVGDKTGASWTGLSGEFDDPFVNGLVLDPFGRRLYAATEGRGVAWLDLDPALPRRGTNRSVPDPTRAPVTGR